MLLWIRVTKILREVIHKESLPVLVEQYPTGRMIMDNVKYVSQIHKKIDMIYHHSVRLSYHTK